MTETSLPSDLHRQSIVAELAADDAREAAVAARIKAKSMLDADIKASFNADIDAQVKANAADAARFRYRNAMNAAYKGATP